MSSVEVRSYDPVIPAGTPEAVPLLVDLSFPARLVNRIEVRVPPGPRGCVGFAIAQSGTPILPYNPGEWIVTDDEVIVWDVEGQSDAGMWQLLAYNTGLLPHTLYVRFLLSLVGTMTGAVPSTVSNALLSSGVVGA